MRHVYQDQTIGGADILNSLADVNINNPEDGQMLVYDTQTQRWRNVTQKSLNDLAEVTDLTNIIATGTTNATGSTIPKGTFFYLNDDLCQAKADIASGATFTENTNYEEVTAGGLNALYSKLTTTSETLQTNEILHKYGNVRVLAINGASTDSAGKLTTIPSGDRPSGNIIVQTVILDSSNKLYNGYLTIDSTGLVSIRYYIAQSTTDAAVGANHRIYTSASWVV